jgi:hypothetical protein
MKRCQRCHVEPTTSNRSKYCESCRSKARADAGRKGGRKNYRENGGIVVGKGRPFRRE